MSKQSEFGIVREAVVNQHRAIEHVLDLAERVARGAIGPTDTVTDEASRVIRKLFAVFEQHLDFEEVELVPFVRHADAWGEERMNLMLDEHEVQRAQSFELFRQLEHGAPAGVVVDLLDAFVRDLRADIAREDRWLNELELLVESVPLNQQTG